MPNNYLGVLRESWAWDINQSENELTSGHHSTIPKFLVNSRCILGFA